MAGVIKDKLAGQYTILETSVLGYSDYAVRVISIQSALIALILIVIGIPILRSAIRSLTSAMQRISEANSSVDLASKELSSMSRSLKQAISGQNAAVTETVAAMTQMQGVISRNNEGLTEAATSAETARALSHQGSSAMNTMSASLQSLASANEDMIHIVDIIEKISKKTGVIDNIVFKTQMLSFNASIEAARAGANGRGFAVVAAEVGRLAEVSGQASSEIGDLLDESRKTVNGLVAQIHKRIEETIQISGSALAHFSSIVSGIALVSDRIQDVKQGSQEQIIGVDQCVTSMNQIDKLAQENGRIASNVENISSRLLIDLGSLNSASNLSKEIVLGSQSLLAETSHRPAEHLSPKLVPPLAYEPHQAKNRPSDAELVELLSQKRKSLQENTPEKTDLSA